MMQRRALLLSLVASGWMAACGGGGDSFSPYGYTGTLGADGGGVTGSFNYTVQDKDGNAAGSATVGGQSFALRGYVADGAVNLQFQDAGAYNGWLTGWQSGSSMSGTWYVEGANSYAGSASGTRTAASGGSGSGSCSSLIGRWTDTSGYQHWNFTSASQAQITTDSDNVPGAQQLTWISYSATGSSITYTITRAALTGAGPYDYDYSQAQLIAQGGNVGPFTEGYALANCQFVIGGKTYSRD